MIKCDSLIFDMDGTLWDAVDSYVTIWNETTRQCGVTMPDVTREQLISLMGHQLEDIMAAINPNLIGNDRYLELLDRNERLMMPALGGRLYAGVAATMAALSRSIPLYMVSNCGSEGLDNFLTFTALRPYVSDTLSHGMNRLSKSENIKLIVRRHNLKHPVYVGDTQSDVNSAHDAGIPCVLADYGFGIDVKDADAHINAFGCLPQVIDIRTNN